MGTIRIGTTAWADRSLIRSGRFYPRDATTSEQRLRYYARRFPIAEVDSTYYAIVSERVAGLWVERTPTDFVFDVKAFRLFTQHRTPVVALPADLRDEAADPRDEVGDGENVYHDALPEELRLELWRRFRGMLEPLVQARKLGVVLLQFAPWFIYGPTSINHIRRCVEALDGVRVAVEMRNKTWFSDRNQQNTLAVLRELGVAHVVADEPQSSSFSIPQVWAATTPYVAVVRLHGRNEATWQSTVPSAAERFAYLYSRNELRQLVPHIRRLARNARDVHVLFNNCHGDDAQRNARSLARLMDEAQTEPLGVAAAPR